jgi:hypothetical protein
MQEPRLVLLSYLVLLLVEFVTNCIFGSGGTGAEGCVTVLGNV